MQGDGGSWYYSSGIDVKASSGVLPAASISAPIILSSANASSILSACFRNLVGGQPKSIFPGSNVDSSIHASHRLPVHIAEYVSKSIQNVLLLQTGQSLQCMLDSTNMPFTPTWSTSQITMSERVSDNRWDLLRNFLRTFHATSSVEKTPSPIVPPSS